MDMSRDRELNAFLNAFNMTSDQFPVALTTQGSTDNTQGSTDKDSGGLQIEELWWIVLVVVVISGVLFLFLKYHANKGRRCNAINGRESY